MAVQLLQMLPRSYKRFIEPMAGSAALFFAARPDDAILADENPELVNFYKVLARSSRGLIETLVGMTASREKYYRLRASRPHSLSARAVRFAYLNRLCWNGIHRVNRRGDFNVPIGDRLPKRLWTKQHLEEASELLRNASLICGDFGRVVEYCQPGDFVFLDPPYPKGSKTGTGFNRYTPSLFTLQDHRRVAAAAAAVDAKGAYIMVTVAWTKPLLSLYSALPFRRRLHTATLIGCKGKARRGTYEAVLRNYC